MMTSKSFYGNKSLPRPAKTTRSPLSESLGNTSRALKKGQVKKSTDKNSSKASKTTTSKDDFKCYIYIMFVDDPNSTSPFNVLHGRHITKMETRPCLLHNHDIGQYNIAFTTVYTHPCRIFAKAQPNSSFVKLHNICSSLNTQLNLLLKCKVDLETAFSQLLAENPNHQKDGIDYTTGEVSNLQNDENMAPDPDVYSDEDLFGPSEDDKVKSDYLKHLPSILQYLTINLPPQPGSHAEVEDVNASYAADAASESVLTPPTQKKARPTVGLKVPRRKHITKEHVEVKK